jgi:hypothetical protein
MIRRVKSLEDATRESGFAPGMYKYCGTDIDIELNKYGDGRYEDWVFGEDYLEPLDQPKSLNHNEGKPRPSLILKDMKKSFEALMEVREFGCKKYDRMNWSVSKGTEHSKEFLDENIDSMLRHIMAYMEGESIDNESGCHHLAQAAIRCMFAIEYD